MDPLNRESVRNSSGSLYSTSTTMFEGLEALNIVSEHSFPSGEPSTGTPSPSPSVSDEFKGWYPISDPWKRDRRIGYKVKFLLDYVDWEQKRMNCEQLHSPPGKCKILPVWAAGTRHLIRRAKFEDGTSYVLKIPFPKYFSEGHHELTLECTTKSNLDDMRQEYETTFAFQSLCDVRVPYLYGIDDGSNKPFPPPHTRYEAPCLYMEYLDGVTAADRMLLGEPSTKTISFLQKQLAQITAKMMSVSCLAAGSIGIDPQPGRKIGYGACETPKAFYKYKGREFHKDHLASKFLGVELAADSFLLLQQFFSIYEALAPQDSFCLINEDLGFHNVLTNEQWEITAVIDIDCVYSGPWSWALKPLWHSWMDVRPDSMIDAYQPLRNYQIETKNAFHYFLREIETALREQGNGSLAREVEKFLKSGGRELMLGMEACQQCDHELHMAWLAEYAKLPIWPQKEAKILEST